MKNLRNDAWREEQLLRSTSNPWHPFHKFGTGNLDTLKYGPERSRLNVTTALRHHFESHYVGTKVSLNTQTYLNLSATTN